jgi:mRNA interferase RelE/StbE
MRYILTLFAVQSLKKLSVADRKRIFEKLDFFFAAANPLSFAKHLRENELGSYRFRVGDFRIIFDVKKDVADIIMVGNRKDIYK